MADLEADCPMAHMATPEKVAEVRSRYSDVAVVCYINSTAKLKECADVCVTSSNAMKIVRALPNKTIYFIPDEHLGRYIAEQVPEKEFIFNDGYCPVHTKITADCVRKAKGLHPRAKVLAHPECTMEVLELADYIGSTSGIIARAGSDPSTEFIICTEIGVFYELKKQNPQKQFYPANHCQICHDMKKVTLEKIAACLVSMEPRVEIGPEQSQTANAPLIRMLELAK
ncbi:MAG: quinolinate synthase NadA, partial [Bacteroidales bacterium]